jgi:phosphoribosylaminoimidazolecarboxamide formyltransferase/IMP cyclohydrolase
MVRSAAKNHDYVAIVTDPADYATLLARAQATDGATTLAFRRKLAPRPAATAASDSAISAGSPASIRTAFPRRARRGPSRLSPRCAMAKIRTSPPRSMFRRSDVVGLPQAEQVQGKNCPTTTTTTPMPRSN